MQLAVRLTEINSISLALLAGFWPSVRYINKAIICPYIVEEGQPPTFESDLGIFFYLKKHSSNIPKHATSSPVVAYIIHSTDMIMMV